VEYPKTTTATEALLLREISPSNPHHPERNCHNPWFPWQCRRTKRLGPVFISIIRKRTGLLSMQKPPGFACTHQTGSHPRPLGADTGHGASSPVVTNASTVEETTGPSIFVTQYLSSRGKGEQGTQVARLLRRMEPAARVSVLLNKVGFWGGAETTVREDI
jgi:hypothetical protein